MEEVQTNLPVLLGLAARTSTQEKGRACDWRVLEVAKLLILTDKYLMSMYERSLLEAVLLYYA